MYDPSGFGFVDEASHARDLKNLRVVSILHYVAGVVTALGSLVFVTLIWLGARTMTTEASQAPASFGPIFVGLGSVALVLGWGTAGGLIHAGRCIASRRRRRWCLFVAALTTVWFPFGTLLGVSTLILLGKPNVREGKP